jgi:oligopeptide/dipeptide ABC transporter ATP-binding protein
MHLAALIAFAGAALVVTLWLLGAVLPYLANNESFGLSSAWEAIGPTGGTLMMWGLVAGPLMWGAGNLVRDRVPTARRALIGLAVVQGVLALIGATGAGTPLSVVAWAIGAVAAVAALVCTVVPAGRNDFAAMAEVRVDHDRIVRRVLSDVGLDPDSAMPRRPHEFSGGQCQRICIARALVLDPKVIICDEPVSALDVSVQAQILNLLQDMKARYDLTLVFIAHDLAVVKNVSDRVAVMYLGKVCEVADPDDLYAHPAHPYSAALLRSIPVPDPTVSQTGATLSGELPSPVDPPSGCRFRTRCPKAQDLCAAEEPTLRAVGENHYVACHFPNEA